MGPSEKSFNQVKSILGMLDRSIDRLREQRTTPAPALSSVPAAPIPAVPKAAIAPIPAAPARESRFGRATPIPPASN